ncbi:DinI-like family protein [Enterobacter roggenkampii]|uniref:DinI-like family protein n=1 Tax=Enterobacter roggenkampii TaxID=1812935 RepID=UPI002DBD73DB|nr:DinI-like family protein [Enterobacter roggenkampii]MEB5886820.1 DinI family protein [Enterobacter roggenkampii]
MDRELNEQVMLERVELIARLTTEASCQEKDREIALNLIAELAKGNVLKSSSFAVVFSAKPIRQRFKRKHDVIISITMDNEQRIGLRAVDAFETELRRRVNVAFPSSLVTVKTGSFAGVEVIGFERESDREKLDNILQEVWEDESWR